MGGSIIIKDTMLTLLATVALFIQRQEDQRGKMMGYIYMFCAVSSDFVSLLFQKSSSNMGPPHQLYTRLGSVVLWNWLFAYRSGISPEPISSAGVYACLKRG